MRTSFQLLLGVLLFCANANSASASIIIRMRETAGNVVFSYRGSLDTTGLLTRPSLDSVESSISPEISVIAFGSSDPVNVYAGILGPLGIGTGPRLTANVKNQGDPFFISSMVLVGVPFDYVPGEPLSGSMIFESTDFASLGIDAASAPYVWTLANRSADTITLTTAIPEPSTFATCMLFTGLAAVRRKRC